MSNAPSLGIAMLLAQLGQHAAERFTARIAELNLTAPQAGILQAIAGEPGRSQQALSEQLGLLPSRVVAFIDDLEQRGLLERRRNPGDRRLYALYLTDQGEALMDQLAAVSDVHEREITTGLTDQQRIALSELLTSVAERQQLGPATLRRSTR
jgi:DNA-binding MarR family transcriptional regulator